MACYGSICSAHFGFRCCLSSSFFPATRANSIISSCRILRMCTVSLKVRSAARATEGTRLSRPFYRKSGLLERCLESLLAVCAFCRVFQRDRGCVSTWEFACQAYTVFFCLCHCVRKEVRKRTDGCVLICSDTLMARRRHEVFLP